MYQTAVAAFAGLLLAGAAWAQELPRLFASGVPSWPAVAALGEAAADTGQAPAGPTKSPKKALLFSAVVPGSGELYAGAEKRGILFAGLEAIGWGLWVTWNGKGNDIDRDFRALADEHWSAESYLLWRRSTISRRSSITHALPCSTYVLTGNLGDCGGRDRQQYYEVLGKYNQFVAGWDDVLDQNGNQVQPTDIDSVENFDSRLRLQYEDQRNDSNRYLKRAGNVAGLILVNHALSAIDAARAARQVSSGKEAAVVERRTRWAVMLQPGSGGQVPFLMAFKPFD